MFEHIFTLPPSSVCVCVCVFLQEPADELPPKRNDLPTHPPTPRPPLLSFGHQVQKKKKKTLTLQAPWNKAQSKPAGRPVSVFMVVPLLFISIQCPSDKQLVIAEEQPFSTPFFSTQTIRQSDNRNNRMEILNVPIHIKEPQRGEKKTWCCVERLCS